MVHQQGMAPAAGLAVSLAAGIGAYYAIERPARQYLNRTWSGRQAAPASLNDANASSAPLA
jgi:peptidoglycan/LPS O-acetylase OafA/YrhL